MEIDGCCWTGSLPGSWRTNYCNAWLTHVLEESFVAGYSAVPEEFDFSGYRTQYFPKDILLQVTGLNKAVLASPEICKMCKPIYMDIQKAFSLNTADFRHWLSGLETRLPVINWKRCPVTCLHAPLFLQMTNNKGNWMLKCKFIRWMLDFMLFITFQQLSAIETGTGIYCKPSIYHTWCFGTVLRTLQKYKFHCFCMGRVSCTGSACFVVP